MGTPGMRTCYLVCWAFIAERASCYPRLMDTDFYKEWSDEIERKKQEAGFTEAHKAILDLVELRLMAGRPEAWELPRLFQALQLVPKPFRSINFDGETYCYCTDKPICAYCQGQDPECRAGSNHAEDCKIRSLVTESFV
jgi:hypothetical protein